MLPVLSLLNKINHFIGNAVVYRNQLGISRVCANREDFSIRQFCPVVIFPTRAHHWALRLTALCIPVSRIICVSSEA